MNIKQQIQKKLAQRVILESSKTGPTKREISFIAKVYKQDGSKFFDKLNKNIVKLYSFENIDTKQINKSLKKLKKSLTNTEKILSEITEQTFFLTK